MRLREEREQHIECRLYIAFSFKSMRNALEARNSAPVETAADLKDQFYF